MAVGPPIFYEQMTSETAGKKFIKFGSGHTYIIHKGLSNNGEAVLCAINKVCWGLLISFLRYTRTIVETVQQIYRDRLGYSKLGSSREKDGPDLERGRVAAQLDVPGRSKVQPEVLLQQSHEAIFMDPTSTLAGPPRGRWRAWTRRRNRWDTT